MGRGNRRKDRKKKNVQDLSRQHAGRRESDRHERDRLEQLWKAGKLHSNQLVLMALLDYKPATSLARQVAGFVDRKHSGMKDLFQNFGSCSRETWLRMAIAAFRAILPDLAIIFPDETQPIETLMAVEQMLIHPSWQSRHESDRLTLIANNHFQLSSSRGTPLIMKRSVALLSQAAGSNDRNIALRSCYQVIKDAAQCLDDPQATSNDNFLGSGNDTSVKSTKAIVKAIRKEIVPWVLGDSDPIKQRLLTQQA